jgi:ribosomal-protein-alanine N-acetyltransferase
MPSLFAPVVPAGALSQRPQPRINGHGLLLRPWRGLDIPALMAAYADPEISHWHARTFSDAHEARDWVRQRVATRALCALSDWAFDDLGLHRLALLHATRNAGSCRVAHRGLYVAEGTLREQALHPDGWHDMHLHARLATDPRP